MQIVIDIPDSAYEYYKTYGLDGGTINKVIDNAILGGTILPKEHGRLMILSGDKLKENQINLDFSCMKWISEIDLSNATIAIIEADNVESEE